MIFLKDINFKGLVSEIVTLSSSSSDLEPELADPWAGMDLWACMFSCIFLETRNYEHTHCHKETI